MTAASRKRLHLERKAAGLRVLECGFAVDDEVNRRLERLGLLEPTANDTELAWELATLHEKLVEAFEQKRELDQLRNAVPWLFKVGGK